MTMFHTKPLAEENGGIPVLAWILILLAFALFVGFIIWWYRRRQAAGADEAQHLPEPHEIELHAAPEPAERGTAAVFAVPEPAEAQEVPAAAAKPDDLVILEGIGPKIATILQSAGIGTFAQLATTEVSRLQEILDAAHLQFIDPASWPEQARLAAAGDWNGLEVLTGQLKGGRQVS